jgi:hypothetical protein
MPYDRLRVQNSGTATGAGSRRKAALAAGLDRYPAIPTCGGGYFNHERSAHSGRCLTCKGLTTKARLQALPISPTQPKNYT